MPGRPLLFDLHGPKATVCRACLSNFSNRVPQAWIAAYSSAANRRRAAPRTAMRRSTPMRASRNTRPASKEEAVERFLAAAREASGSENPITEADLGIRFFEQDDKGRQQLTDEDEFNQSLDGFDPSEIKTALEDIKHSIKGEDERIAFGNVMGQLDKVFSQIRSTKDVGKLNEYMDTYSESIDRRLEEATASLPQGVREKISFDVPDLSADFGLPLQGMKTEHPQIMDGPWSLNQRRKIARLNSAIARVNKDIQHKPGPAKKDIIAIYKAYHAARLTLAHSWSHVPVDVWDFLWKVFSADESINIHRLAHISMLTRDMSAAKVSLAPSQQLLAIEAMFMEGWDTKAIESWKRCMGTLGRETAETYKEFWELGVLMHCRMGDLEQAKRSADKILAKRMDSRVLLPLIRAYSEQKSEGSKEKAWAAYRQMRDLLGKHMKLSDYDKVVAYFLTTGQTENALYAFVDMMSDGQIDLTVQKFMPSVVANKFFVGKWLKRLIGANDLDGAYSVVEFMRTKGVEASPLHVNGLIGAWQRSGGAQDLELSEKVAWEMIENRRHFVKARKAPTKKPKAKFDKSAPAPLPRATLETFCILAENYRLRELHSQQATLWNAFRDCEISPDAFMMNQLLESHIQGGEIDAALELYRLLVGERGVKPDPYTFSALWKTLDVNRMHIVGPEMQSVAIAGARQMFAETVAYRPVFGAGMDGQLARKILHSFRRIKDQAGMLVALTALKDVFNFLPTEMMVLELQLGTTKLSWDAPTQRRKLIHAKKDMERDLMSWCEGDVAMLEGENRGAALYEYLQRQGLRRLGDNPRQAVVAASEEMGVYELLRQTSAAV